MNKEQRKIYNMAYRQNHLEQMKIHSATYYQRHKEQRKAASKRYRQGHLEQIKVCEKARKKRYYQANIEKIKAYTRAYRIANLEKDRIHSRKRRAIKCKAYHESYTGNYVFLRDGWICGICGRKINKRLKYPNPLSPSIDHIVPLSKGGSDTIFNVQATHLRCNLGKNATNKGQLRLFG